VWPNGETHWLMVRGRATYDEAGKARRMLGISLDITERKRLHEALQQSESDLARQAEELRDADRRKDEFLATLAHELRNPLAPIRTGMDLLARAPGNAAAERTLGVMNRQLSHMVRLIDDLLDVSRITRGKLELKRERVQLSSIIEAAVEASRPLIERKQHTLHISVADPSLCFDADLTRMAQVVSNLLNNASNYTPVGGLLQLSARTESGFAVIEVRDNGIGIPRDRLEDVFGLFRQIHRTLERSQGGLGIGLALVRSLVEMHGGRVAAASDGLGTGSTFSVWLPIFSGGTQPDRAEQSERPLPPQTKPRILVVDDNEDAADLLALSLTQKGYSSATAYDGASALRAVAASKAEVVILDIGLPDMSGYDVARAIRQDSRLSSPTLIALTGWGSQDDKRKATDAGFDLHLTKPVDARQLDDALQQLVARDCGRAGRVAGGGADDASNLCPPPSRTP
jgi:signal transduction histidine kinase/ActR/RegA family two-component response regulator